MSPRERRRQSPDVATTVTERPTSSRTASRMQMLAARVRQRAGAECVYHEGDVWARGRLTDIRTDAWGVRARVEVIPPVGSLAADPPAYEISGSWAFLRAWPTHWSLPWVSWVLVFDPAAVEEFVARAAQPAPRGTGERRRDLERWLEEHLAGWFPGGGSGSGTAGPDPTA